MKAWKWTVTGQKLILDIQGIIESILHLRDYSLNSEEHQRHLTLAACEGVESCSSCCVQHPYQIDPLVTSTPEYCNEKHNTSSSPYWADLYWVNIWFSILTEWLKQRTK